MFMKFAVFLAALQLQLYAAAIESQLPANSSAAVWKANAHAPHSGGPQHLIAKARKTYRAVVPCLLGLTPGPGPGAAGVGPGHSAENATVSAAAGKWKFPADAEQHYQDILARTKAYRNLANKEPCVGIEKLFIARYSEQPLSFFGGLVPIFMDFVDMFCANETSYKEALDSLATMLRPDVIYVALSQNDVGLTKKFCSQRPNILVLSAGGFGHIPIPLVKEANPLPSVRDLTEFSLDASFMGDKRTYPNRGKILAQWKALVDRHNSHSQTQFRYITDKHSNWKKIVQGTKFNLAPRGYGRTSFRLSELVQMGRLPVYLYDDVPWLPYENTRIALSTFGYMGQMDRLDAVFQQLLQANSSQVAEKLQQLQRVRPYFTFEGVLQQIDAFFRDPLGAHGGFLRCERQPDTEH